MLLCRKKSSIAECVGRGVQAAPSVWSARESNSLCFHELSCCMGKQNILLPTVVGCKHMSNGTEELWNSFMYHQILWRIRKRSEYQGVQAHSQVSPFQLCFPPVALRSQISEQQNLLLSPTLTLALLSAMGWVMTVSQFEIWRIPCPEMERNLPNPGEDTWLTEWPKCLCHLLGDIRMLDWRGAKTRWEDLATHWFQRRLWASVFSQRVTEDPFGGEKKNHKNNFSAQCLIVLGNDNILCFRELPSS